MKNLFTLLLTFTINLVSGQDYAMFEVHYLRPNPGNGPAVGDLIANHNKLFHNDGPYQNTVFSVLTGPRTGDYLFAMGPCTFSQLDGRPSGDDHNQDWAGIQALCERIDNVRYATRNDELSYAPEGDTGTRTLSRVRYFEVVDNELFIKVQSQIIKTIAAMGGKNPRTMYQTEFLSNDNVHWATVTTYKSWADLDADSVGNFQETFKKVNGGDKAWTTFQDDFDKAVVSRRDEMRVLLPELSGGN